jgi:hypothetical protein
MLFWTQHPMHPDPFSPCTTQKYIFKTKCSNSRKLFDVWSFLAFLNPAPLARSPFFPFYIFFGLVAGCHSFCLFSYFITYTHSFNHIHTVHLSIAFHWGLSLHFFIACPLSGKDLPVVPSRESNSNLHQADALPTEPRRTITFSTQMSNTVFIDHSSLTLLNIFVQQTRKCSFTGFFFVCFEICMKEIQMFEILSLAVKAL